MLTFVSRRATGSRPSNLYRPMNLTIIPKLTPFQIYRAKYAEYSASFS